MDKIPINVVFISSVNDKTLRYLFTELNYKLNYVKSCFVDKPKAMMNQSKFCYYIDLIAKFRIHYEWLGKEAKQKDAIVLSNWSVYDLQLELENSFELKEFNDAQYRTLNNMLDSLFYCHEMMPTNVVRLVYPENWIDIDSKKEKKLYDKHKNLTLFGITQYDCGDSSMSFAYIEKYLYDYHLNKKCWGDLH